jgi:uncharacterized protein (DUF433 family)
VSDIASDDARVRRAIFTLREAAGYLGLPKSTLHDWARPADGRAIVTCFPPRGREASVPFIGFAEAYVLSAFRRAGVPPQRIRPAVDALSAEIGIDHALASERLYTDGAEVDPHRAFGMPLLVHGGARVEGLVDRFKAGDTLAGIATDFGVPQPEVEEVVRVATRAAA